MQGRTKSASTRPQRREDERDRVVTATIELLLSDGVAGLRLDQVAALAGVPKHTIYRRWPSLAELVVEALEHALGESEVERTGDPVADFVRLFRTVHKRLVGHQSGRRLLVVIQEVLEEPKMCPTFRARVIDPLRDQAIDLAAEAARLGRLRVALAPAQLVDMLLGLILYRTIVLDAELPGSALQDVLQAMLVTDRAVVSGTSALR